MKTITINLYSFDELSTEAKEKAISSLFDINIDHEWWDGVYYDAENIGLKITSFDIGRSSYCRGDIITEHLSVASKIIQEHGKDCETFKTAEKFLSDYDELVAKYSDGIDKTIVIYENESDFDNECNDLEEDFLNSLLEDYRIILSQEYEYLTSEEQIIETIQINDYYFTIDGELE